MAHVQNKYSKLWKPQDIGVDKVSPQKMFVENIDFLEELALSVLKRTANPVASITELRAIDTTDTSLYTDGMTIMVKSNGLYFFDRNSTSVDDGKTIITPTTGGGRWISDTIFISDTNLTAHISNKSNPHGVTATQVGLGNVPNVSTNNQTPTYSQASTLTALTSGEILAVAMSKISKGISDLITHLANTSNPHSVTKSQVGLGNVDNVSTDNQKPTYTAATSLTALTSGETLSTAMGKISKGINVLIAHLNTTNPHGVTAADIGLGEISGDMDVFVGHTSAKNNPHSVTKSQVGLSNVDNTSDTNKPVSTAQKTAIDTVQTNLNTHTGKKDNPHGVTATQVGLGNVPNVATNDQTPTYTEASTLTALASGERLSVSMGKIMKGINAIISHLADKNNPHGVTGAQVGLTTHTGNTSNPHSVTATQVGLGNVPNVATNDQTPTYSQASTLATLTSGEKLSVSMGKIMKGISDLITHLANTSNPHSVTKSQVGLGNVNNTSDASKPVSTAQQKAINDAKAECAPVGLVMDYDSSVMSDSYALDEYLYEMANQYADNTVTHLVARISNIDPLGSGTVHFTVYKITGSQMVAKAIKCDSTDMPTKYIKSRYNNDWGEWYVDNGTANVLATAVEG